MLSAIFGHVLHINVLYYVTNNYKNVSNLNFIVSNKISYFPITISLQELKKTNWRHIN